MIPRKKLSAYKKVDFSANEPATPQSELSSKIELLDDSPLEPEIIEPFGDDSPVQAFPSKYHQKKSQEQDYQEMLIVRQSLDFDERQFRDSYIKTESEIILKMRSKKKKILLLLLIFAIEDVDSLYDWLDKMVAELTKTLNQCQEAKRGSTEDKLKTIREHSVRADAINRSIQNFLSSIQHAYQHTFAAFLDSNAPQK